jgi:hypothetical protein
MAIQYQYNKTSLQGLENNSRSAREALPTI